MKNIGVKIILIILVIGQIGLGIKSILLIKPFLNTKDATAFSTVDLVIFTSFLAITLINSIIFIFLIMSKDKKTEKTESEIITKSEVKDKAEQKQLRDDEKKRIQLLAEKKKSLIADLTKDLNLNEGLQKYTEKVLINISKQFNIMQGLFFMKNPQDKIYRKVGTYAYYSENDLREFTEDIGLSGQVATNKKLLNISNIPDKYITVISGLGQSSPANLIIFPILQNNETIGIIELASFVKFDLFAEEVFMELSPIIGNQLITMNSEKNLVTS